MKVVLISVYGVEGNLTLVGVTGANLLGFPKPTCTP